MRGYAYTDLENHKHNLVLLDQSNVTLDYSVAQNNHVMGLLMSRLDFDSKIIQVPPIPDNAVRDMLSYKIRSLYPGDPANTRFDYKLFTAKKKRYAVVFICKKPVIQEYKDIAGKKLLLLPFTLLKGHINKYKEQDACFLFWHPDWVELFTLEQGVLTATTAIKRAKHMKSDFRKIIKILAKEQEGMSFINYCAEDEHHLISEHLEIHFPKNPREIRLFKDFFSHSIRKSEALFAPERRTKLPPFKQRLTIYGFTLLFCFGLLYNKCAVHMLAYEEYLEQKRNESVRLYADISSMQNEISKLEEKLLALRVKKPVNVYHMFNDLSSVFTGQTELLSFILKGSSFQMEGRSINALSLEERLKKHSSFSQVSLPEFKPERNSYKERFRMQGVYHAQ
jgi:hypothetical protein